VLWTDRRAFLGFLSGALSFVGLPGALRARLLPDLDATRLRSLAEAVLPSRLGAEGVARVVEAFEAWLAAYRPGAERSHGYGSDSMDIRYLPPDPTARWRAQLEELDASARQRFGGDFAALSLDQRRSLLRERLAAAPGSTPTSPADADHVAVALMAFWFGGAEAEDLAYGGAIAKETCRPLDTVGERPAPVARAEGP